MYDGVRRLVCNTCTHKHCTIMGDNAVSVCSNTADKVIPIRSRYHPLLSSCVALFGIEIHKSKSLQTLKHLLLQLLLLYETISYSLNITREKIFMDFKDF